MGGKEVEEVGERRWHGGREALELELASWWVVLGEILEAQEWYGRCRDSDSGSADGIGGGCGGPGVVCRVCATWLAAKRSVPIVERKHLRPCAAAAWRRVGTRASCRVAAGRSEFRAARRVDQSTD
mgnify:CR=1 FL=1